MKYRQWFEAMETLASRTLPISGIFYHITEKQHAKNIIKAGFSFARYGQGFGTVDLGEPKGISFFLKKDETKKHLKPNQSILEVTISSVKTLDARNIENGSWIQYDGGWPEFISHFFNLSEDEAEDVFDSDFVTNLLLKSGYGAILHANELRLLDLKHITKISDHTP